MNIDLLNESQVHIVGCTFVNTTTNRNNPLIRVETREKETCLDNDVVLITIEDCAIMDIHAYNNLLEDYKRLKELKDGSR